VGAQAEWDAKNWASHWAPEDPLCCGIPWKPLETLASTYRILLPEREILEKEERGRGRASASEVAAVESMSSASSMGLRTWLLKGGPCPWRGVSST